ncbi:hypothetical protein KR009_002975 [Drosophila setifemur]|nr:hypothetical protein KR009_002975 [Drosophila setifemur]
MRYLHLAAILIFCSEHALAQGMPISPCPKVFQYRFDGSEWFGLMAVRSPDARQQLHIRVTLSMRGKPTTVRSPEYGMQSSTDSLFSNLQNYLGEIELLTRGQFSKSAPILYKIRFPKHHFPPKLLLVSANNQVICFGSGEHSIFMTQIQLEHIRKLTFIPDGKSSLLEDGKTVAEVTFAGEANEFGAKPPQTQFKKKPFSAHRPKEICGRIDRGLDFRSSDAGLSSRGSDGFHSPVFADDDDGFEHLPEDEEELTETDGEEDSVSGSNTLPSITRGSWPWLAAIYVNNLTSLDFQCGGTLVSSRAVISSAHCFRMFNQRYTANEVLVFLGRHNLKNWNEEGSLAAPVDGIYIHPDYNSQLSSYDADIAVIMLKDEVRFNTFIRPACLWSGSSKVEYILGEHGIVIGWSFDRSNTTQTNPAAATLDSGQKAIDTSTPKLVKAPIIGSAKCFRANAHFRSLSSNRTFCAGMQVESHNGGLYTGISGAGLLILKNNRWMLRGAVSATLPAEKTSQAGVERYMIYADVAKFLDWITAFII